MKKIAVLALTLVMFTGFMTGCKGFSKPSVENQVPREQPQTKEGVIVVTELPPNLEENNPIPMVTSWNEEGRTFYYFSMGMKPTGGYLLELIGVENDLIKVKAIEPAKDAAVIQMLTYPRLLVSLPEGEYKYQVYNEAGEKIEFPQQKTEPLAFKVVIPDNQGKLIERTIYRDPHAGNEGKTTGQIWLEALWEQPEFQAQNFGVNILGVSFDEKDWVVLFSNEYNTLTAEQKAQLDKLIQETMLKNPVERVAGVKITTNPAELPELEN